MNRRPAEGEPLVSVVVTFLDAERFIEEAIESVFAQTYCSWELLLVDDGSRDGSSAIARRYAGDHPDRIRYLEHPGHVNRGISASRNLGMRHARGDLMAFLDADDVWFPHKLAEQVPLLERHPGAGMLYGTTQSWYSWTGHAEDAGRDTVPPLGVQPDTLLVPGALLERMLTRSAHAPCIGSMLVRRGVAEAVGGFDERFRGMYEDQVFVAKLSLRAPVFAASRCWSRYRRHPASCYSIARADGSYRQARITYLRWLMAHLARHGLRGTELWNVAGRELRKDRGPALRRAGRYLERVAPAVVATVRHGTRVLPSPLRQWLRARPHDLRP